MVPGAVVPLVGRESELGRLVTLVDATVRGNGGFVLIGGRMGVGKTRLAEEVLAVAAKRGCRVLVGRAVPFQSGLTFAPIVGALGPLVRSSESEVLVADLPLLGRLWPDVAPTGTYEPVAAAEQSMLFESVARLLERAAAARPLVLLIDDLHWADSATQDLVAYLAARAGELALLLVTTFRKDELAERPDARRLLAGLRSLPGMQELVLAELSPTAVDDLASALLTGPPPAGLSALLQERAAGIALFVRGLVLGLMESGALMKEGEGWTLATAAAVRPTDELRQVILDRLDRCGEHELLVAQLVALSTSALAHDVLRAAAGLDDDALVAEVARLLRKGLLVEDLDDVIVRYRLEHPLVRDVVAESMPTVTKRRMHAQLGLVIAALQPNAVRTIARHLVAAGDEVDLDDVYRAVVPAARAAAGLGAPEEAAAMCEAALARGDGSGGADTVAVLEQLGESREQLGLRAAAASAWSRALPYASADPGVLSRLHRRLAALAWDRLDEDETRRHLEAGLELSGPRSPERAQLLLVRLRLEHERGGDADAVELVEEMRRLAVDGAGLEAGLAHTSVLLARGEFDRARREATAVLTAAQVAEDWVAARRAHLDLTLVAWQTGDNAALHLHIDQARGLQRRLGLPADDAQLTFRSTVAALITGDWADARLLAASGVAAARRDEYQRLLASCLGVQAVVSALHGDLDAATAAADEAVAAAAGQAPHSRALLLVAWGRATLAAERDEPRMVMAYAAGLRRGLGSLLGLPLIARAQAALGERSAVLTTADALDGLDGEVAAGHARLARGLAAEPGDPERADHLDAASRHFEHLAMPFEVALARFHRGDVEALRDALATFSRLEAQRWAGRTRSALRKAGAPVIAQRAPRLPGSPMSAREMEVAHLVARGMSNADIAAELVISIRTVTSHLDHIYARLGVRSRLALARWLTQHTDTH